MKNLRNLKFTNEIKGLKSKIKWFLFTEMQDLKLTSNYINAICPDEKKEQSNPIENMETMVRESLIREFSPEIQNSKSFDLLVDAVMYNLQKKSLEEDDKEATDTELDID